MNAITKYSVKAVLRGGLVAAAAICAAYGQTLINLGTQGRNVDFTNAQFTRPVKTGATLPATCSSGDLFFNTSAPAGKNLYGCATANTWTLLGGNFGLSDPGANGIVLRNSVNTTTSVPAPAGAVVGTTDTQTLTNKSIDASEINTGTFAAAQVPAFSGDISVPAGTTTATLATVNSSPGTYGDATHSTQLTVDSKGRITAISQVTIGGASGNSPSINAGSLATMSTSCSAGALYLATDQPAGQQIYTCSSANIWTQIGSLGPSGALAFTNGSLDIVTSIVPRLLSANTFTGLNTFSNGIQIQGTGSQPTCGSTTRGVFWYQNNGSAKDSVQVCVYNGSSFAWISLY